jgi:hypothetical protein
VATTAITRAGANNGPASAPNNNCFLEPMAKTWADGKESF